MMYGINEEVILKKPHPCGGRAWEIVRVGVDIKLRCKACGRFLNVTRDELKKRAKTVNKQDGEGV
jgi:hypothetical protein